MRRLVLPVLVLPLLLAGCVQITPSSGLHDGQAVTVKVSQFPGGKRVWLSQCAPGQKASPTTGCAGSLTNQPSLVLDHGGNGSRSFVVRSTVGGHTCGSACSVVATDGHSVQTATLGFAAAPGTLRIGNGLGHRAVDVYNDGAKVGTVPDIGSAPAVPTSSGTHAVALRAAGAPTNATPLAAGTATVQSGTETSSVGRNTTTGTAVTSTLKPADPGPGQLRVRWVNTMPVPITVQLATVPGPTIAPGQSADMTVNGQAGVPDGDDNWGAEYAPTPPSTDRCGFGNAGGPTRGHAYVITVTYARNLAGGGCPWSPYDVVS